MRMRTKGEVDIVTGEDEMVHRDTGKRTKSKLRVGVCGAVGQKAGRMTRKVDRVSCELCIEGQRTHPVPMLQRRSRSVSRALRQSLGGPAAK